MSMDFQKLKTVEDFYAHALGLEHEFEERLSDLSGCMDGHNNPDAAKVFMQARVLHEVRIKQLEQHVAERVLPRIAPWDYIWHYSINLEVICMTSLHYLMTPLEALEMVEEKIEKAHDFYQQVVDRFDGNEIADAARFVLQDFELELAQFREWHDDLEPCEVLEDHDPPNEPV